MLIMTVLSLVFLSPSAESMKSFELQHEWTLGSEDGEDWRVFSNRTFFAVQDNGDLVILDGGHVRIHLVSPDGVLKASFGTKGQGPGEYTSPSEIAVAPDGSIHVFDAEARLMNVHDSEGSFLAMKHLPDGVVAVLQPNVLADGSMVMTVVQIDQNGQQWYRLSRYDADFNVIEAYGSQAQPMIDWNQSGQPSFWATFLKNHMEMLGKGWPLAASFADQHVAMNTAEYKGTIVDLSGGKSEFNLKNKPRLMSDDARDLLCDGVYDKVCASGSVSQFLTFSTLEQAKSRAEFPETLAPVTLLFAADDGFGVLANYDPALMSGRIDLFDEKGRRSASGAFEGPAEAMRFLNGRLYVLGTNEEGTVQFKRFSLNRNQRDDL